MKQNTSTPLSSSVQELLSNEISKVCLLGISFAVIPVLFANRRVSRLMPAGKSVGGVLSLVAVMCCIFQKEG